MATQEKKRIAPQDISDMFAAIEKAKETALKDYCSAHGLDFDNSAQYAQAALAMSQYESTLTATDLDVLDDYVTTRFNEMKNQLAGRKPTQAEESQILSTYESVYGFFDKVRNWWDSKKQQWENNKERNKEGAKMAVDMEVDGVTDILVPGVGVVVGGARAFPGLVGIDAILNGEAGNIDLEYLDEQIDYDWANKHPIQMEKAYKIYKKTHKWPKNYKTL